VASNEDPGFINLVRAWQAIARHLSTVLLEEPAEGKNHPILLALYRFRAPEEISVVSSSSVSGHLLRTSGNQFTLHLDIRESHDLHSNRFFMMFFFDRDRDDSRKAINYARFISLDASVYFFKLSYVDAKTSFPNSRSRYELTVRFT
jgi:hypothetical protein